MRVLDKEMSYMKISIIIPVFNTSTYLKQCVQSILQQDFKDYEIILVNDGSTDSSANICNYYSERYNFITTIHKSNGGLSDARNKGLKCAKGDFVLFIDSDDYIEANSLSAINASIEENENVDVIFLEAIKVYSDNKKVPLGDGYKKEHIYKKSREEVLVHLSKLSKFPASACTKLVRRTLLVDNKIYFKKGLLSEDVDWTIRLLMYAKSFNYCPNLYYYYRQNREGSITNNRNLRNTESLLEIIRKWSKKLETTGIQNIIKKCIYAFLSYEYIMILLLYGNLNNVEKAKVKQEIKSFSWLLKRSEINKVKIVKVLYYIFGIGITSYILCTYQKLREFSNLKKNT